MWYFSWILGVGLAAAFAILNAMWFELDADRDALTRPLETPHADERAPRAVTSDCGRRGRLPCS